MSHFTSPFRTLVQFLFHFSLIPVHIFIFLFFFSYSRQVSFLFPAYSRSYFPFLSFPSLFPLILLFTYPLIVSLTLSINFLLSFLLSISPDLSFYLFPHSYPLCISTRCSVFISSPNTF